MPNTPSASSCIFSLHLQIKSQLKLVALHHVSETWSLIYFTGAPRFPKSPPGPASGFLGKETKLPCDLLGNPVPEVKWTRSPPAPLPQGRSEVRKDGLYITNTKLEDGGVYTCIATNEYGMEIHGTFLNVKAVGKRESWPQQKPGRDVLTIKM